VGRRGYLRPRTGLEGEPASRTAPVEDLGDNFNQADAERLRNSLSKADSENLERITRSVIEAQEAAAGSGVQIAVSMPLRGRILEFDRPVQVKPNSEMMVSFKASPVVPAGVKKDWAWVLGLFGAVLAALGAWPSVTRKWAGLRSRLEARDAALSTEPAAGPATQAFGSGAGPGPDAPPSGKPGQPGV
jgi:hypothetical protein